VHNFNFFQKTKTKKVYASFGTQLTATRMQAMSAALVWGEKDKVVVVLPEGKIENDYK
jgi:hypothetical protein